MTKQVDMRTVVIHRFLTFIKDSHVIDAAQRKRNSASYCCTQIYIMCELDHFDYHKQWPTAK